jgi:hypothetical protein
MDAAELYAKYACVPASMLSATFEGDLILAQRNPFLVNNVIRPLVARLRDDPEAVGHVCNTLFTSANPNIKASFSKILAFSGSFTVDRDRWSRDEIGRQESLQSPEVGYDLLAKMPRTVNLCLLESLGEASSLDQAILD